MKVLVFLVLRYLWVWCRSALNQLVSLHLINGHIFSIKAENLSNENIFVDKVYLNNVELIKKFITYDDIIKGGNLTFKMKSRKDKSSLEKFKTQ